MIHKTAEATSDLVCNKIAGNITTKVSKTSTYNSLETVKSEIEIPKKRCISSELTEQIIDDLRLE